jgi:hypothetical protein
MAGVAYKITGTRFGASFAFDLFIEDDGRSLLGRAGQWRISGATGLGTLGPFLAPGGTWDFKTFPPGRGFLFLHVDGRERSPFDIALDDVPYDYVHGPFCSVEGGKGTLSPSVQENIAIEWKVTGPGCV